MHGAYNIKEKCFDVIFKSLRKKIKDFLSSQIFWNMMQRQLINMYRRFGGSWLYFEHPRLESLSESFSEPENWQCVLLHTY